MHKLLLGCCCVVRNLSLRPFRKLETGTDEQSTPGSDCLLRCFGWKAYISNGIIILIIGAVASCESLNTSSSSLHASFFYLYKKKAKKQKKTAAIKPLHVAPAIVANGLVAVVTCPGCRRLPQVLKARLGSVPRRSQATWGKFFVCTLSRSP